MDLSDVYKPRLGYRVFLPPSLPIYLGAGLGFESGARLLASLSLVKGTTTYAPRYIYIQLMLIQSHIIHLPPRDSLVLLYIRVKGSNC